MPKLPVPVTPSEAKRVWESQREPSARSVATALSQAGLRVHYTTIARWKARGWPTVAAVPHPLERAQRALDLAVPVLTGDPTTIAIDLVEASSEVSQSEPPSIVEALERAIRENQIAVIAVCSELGNRAAELVRTNTREVAVLITALEANLSATARAVEQLQLLRAVRSTTLVIRDPDNPMK